jgi:hypothetical protein
MKKFAAVLLGCALTFGFTSLAETTPADQKWLEAVEKMVTNGEKKVSTPKEERVALLKEWSGKKGYTVKVTKNDKGYVIELTPKASSNTVARK